MFRKLPRIPTCGAACVLQQDVDGGGGGGDEEGEGGSVLGEKREDGGREEGGGREKCMLLPFLVHTRARARTLMQSTVSSTVRVLGLGGSGSAA